MRFQHVVNKIEQLLTLSREIEESYDKLTKNGIDTVTNTRVQTRLSDLKEVWGQFSLIHNLVNSSIPELADQEQDEINNHVYFIDRIYERTKEDYLDSLEKFTSLLDGGQSSTTETVSNQSTALPSTSIAQIPIAKLPFIKIPTFDGDPEKWLPFKNLFASLISTSTSLSEVEKLQYLKTHLSGSAFDLVKHTALTAENFKQTWDSLTEFFENTRLLVNTTIQSFLNLKRMTKESATELQQLYSNITQLYRTLETLERPVEQCEDFIILISAQKLDAETNKLWESHLGSTRKPPTWKQFKEFLFSRMSSLQSFERSQQKRSLQPTKPNSVQVHHQSKLQLKSLSYPRQGN
ncbi:Uncharacterized protein DBV15_12272 [Temnothorax longispinosus]|uniref:Uncharacterized protein n=1 Tax=Temnothorax longispinosus TaxID=300112 RepID=A0A4S2KEY0_9HYME|nr:Uncharacterized protein DBV15_12272 [Temnothorax longispinosus]